MAQMTPTVVVVDDDPDTLDFLSAYFAMLGFAAASCALDSHVTACIAQYRPRLVVLDVKFGGVIDGVDLFHELRANPAMATVPVIFFTASEDLLRRKLPDYRVLAAHLVGKPDIDLLAALARQILNQPA